MVLGFLVPALRVLRVLKEMADKHRGLQIDLSIGIQNLQSELRVIGQNIENHEDQEFQELAYDIEDFLPDIFIPGGLDSILTALRLDRGTKQVGIINHFLDNIKKLMELQTSQMGEVSGSTSSSSSLSSSIRHDTVLVGTAKSELVDLLSAADRELRVVSIVGCNGLGKTALAKTLYNDTGVDLADKFVCKAFVVASEGFREAGDTIPKKAANILWNILQQVCTTPATANDDGVTQLAKELRTFLRRKRYLVVVDDIKELKLWEEMESAFPNDKTSASRIIVTTSIQSVATSLSRGRYRYTMGGLNMADSVKLFSKEIYGNEPNDPINQAIVNSSESILIKCGGSPLALVSAAKHLKRNLKAEYCEIVGRALGTQVADAKVENSFRELKRLLVECYGSLPKYHHRRSLLSIVMSPHGYPINKNSLLRRWIAEGLVSIDDQHNQKDVACMSFHQFVYRSIIGPGLSDSNSNIKRYQVQGIILEFIIHKSTCVTNFTTIVHHSGRLPLQKYVNKRMRRLFISDGVATSFIKEIANHLEFVRWLTVCPTSTGIPFDLSKCTLLRVLDLESCKGIDVQVLSNICKLVKSLKYLSLRGSDVKHIPKEIKDLVNLETLDIRETEVKMLPMEVLLMPGLAHLFGKFELVGSYKVLLSLKEKESQHKGLVTRLRKATKKHNDKCFRWESNLETLSGIIIDNEADFKEIMLHAEKLKKVKIWCKMATKPIITITEKLTGSKILDSLSVDSGHQPIDMLTDKFLESLSGACAIKSLKLRGPLQGMPIRPGSFMKLKQVGKLHLSSTGLKWEDLSVLQKMSCLSKLRLAEDRCEIEDESFIVEKGGFPSLEILCIKGPKLPKVQLRKGATPSLVSLELLVCPGAPLQNHATTEIPSPQVEATPEINKAEPETLPQNRLMSDGTTAQPAARLQVEATSNITTHQSMVLTQTAVAEIEVRLGVEGLLHLARLGEVIIQDSADLEKVRDWEKIAKMHRNKPYIKKSNHGQEATAEAPHAS